MFCRLTKRGLLFPTPYVPSFSGLDRADRYLRDRGKRPEHLIRAAATDEGMVCRVALPRESGAHDTRSLGTCSGGDRRLELAARSTVKASGDGERRADCDAAENSASYLNSIGTTSS